jgi:hypothetical protein
MAKQSFTTGQVLTAAQMTSLQQTAMGGGSPSTKTASYVLVAADAGTVIQMNSASATTITVNTSLFAAGDSVQIQNIGAGVCTITAGTATVNSAGSLGVTQYDGGFLYFSSTSSAIWFDYTQAGTALPLTTKGDLFGYSTTNARIPVGADATILTADSTQALGVKWAAPASGGGMTLLSTTTLTGSSNITISSINQSYTNLMLSIYGVSFTSAESTVYVRVNGNSTGHYGSGALSTNTSTAVYNFSDNALKLTSAVRQTGALNAWTVNFPEYTNTSSYKVFNWSGFSMLNASTNNAIIGGGAAKNTAAITSFEINTDDTFSTGTVKIWGIK